MGTTIRSLEHAKILGPAAVEVWLKHMGGAGQTKPAPASAPEPESEPTGEKLNGMEERFWGKLKDAKTAGAFREVWEHPFKLRVINKKRYYIPDFVGQPSDRDKLTIYETKGWLREDAELKLLAAAERYRCFNWVLVKCEKKVWLCRNVTPWGFSREVWTPDWLR